MARFMGFLQSSVSSRPLFLPVTALLGRIGTDRGPAIPTVPSSKRGQGSRSRGAAKCRWAAVFLMVFSVLRLGRLSEVRSRRIRFFCGMGTLVVLQLDDHGMRPAHTRRGARIILDFGRQPDRDDAMAALLLGGL